ncbi:MAG: aminoacetone oxidase family FAD-binding enzyme [Bacteroidales bacterium]|nr:aminoacetone oxidase family FAD-binding enzyme [Bacteroidales bacterium]
MKTAVVGGGAAGFFTAINLKEMCPQMEVTIFERSHRLLQKVKVSGGGRCNCTNTFENIGDLSQVYPRGHRLMKRLLKGFSHHDAYRWFEAHGVPLTIQPDHCVFPAAQDSQAIIDCFLQHARRLKITIQTDVRIDHLPEDFVNTSTETSSQSEAVPSHNTSAAHPLSGYDFIVLAMGGQPKLQPLQWISALGHEIAPPVPSLFTFAVSGEALHELMGTVVEDTVAFIPGTRFRANGAVLITHWGMSGPAILKLSSYSARYLAENNYHAPLAINWTNHNEEEVRQHLHNLLLRYPQKQISSLHPFDLPSRLWIFLVQKALDTDSLQKGNAPLCTAVSKKLFNRLVNILTADNYTIASRTLFKDEFVTCGGVALSEVDAVTLESRHVRGLYFAGEMLDIDGITGGFNFQAAWTTGYTIAQAIAERGNG